MSASTLRVVVATPLADDDAERIVTLEPRIELIRDASLLPPMRHAADFAGDPAFRRSSTQQRAFEKLVDSADALYGIPDVDPRALARTVRANPELRWVQTMAAGGGSQVRAAQLEPRELERVAFTTSAGVHGGPLAEFAVFGVLAGAKDLPRLAAQQRWRRWTSRWAMKQVSDMTILVLGLGGIGRETAHKLQLLGARVIGFSRSGDGAPEGTVGERIERLGDHLPQADAIVVTLPGTTATESLLGDIVFDAVKPGVIVVNVGRGTVIDEPALTRALADGRVGFAALDVFAVEPLSGESPLWDHPNVLVSPHTAALDPREERRIAELFADNAGRLLDGRPLRNVVDTVEFY
ncbi:D-2-hydroxyacid dehydrogenase [Microbacterium sp. NPDC056044]|uniref:D-2-hydroxyacid dehydrogenase n=1 Tax=Microbacterium sp. NPDC056044 TaxID=3345690 RepID=UPI0035DFD899